MERGGVAVACACVCVCVWVGRANKIDVGGWKIQKWQVQQARGKGKCPLTKCSTVGKSREFRNGNGGRVICSYFERLRAWGILIALGYRVPGLV